MLRQIECYRKHGCVCVCVCERERERERVREGAIFESCEDTLIATEDMAVVTN